MIHSSMPTLVFNPPSIGMENPLADNLDRESDYGSDFSPDEELLLSQLLQKDPPTLIRDTSSENNLRGGLENNESIRSTAIPHTTSQGSRNKGGPTAWKVAAKETRTSISLEGYGSTFTDRR